MKKNTKFIIAAVVVIILVTGITVFALNSKSTDSKKTSENVLENEPTIAPVDSSVAVDFKQGAKKGEALLTVKNAPAGTKDIEFELSYDAESAASEDSAGGSTQQGAIGKCEKSGDTWECGEPSTDGRKIVLGTCSSGVCRYHKITSQVDVRLSFTGGYGARKFEKKYSL
ncbi:hypothetical protein HYS00_01130 [Candidatus Microgenomates bacterium]|nr:hypothetical protein [Candidatus Microgenomates bacterium]